MTAAFGSRGSPGITDSTNSKSLRTVSWRVEESVKAFMGIFMPTKDSSVFGYVISCPSSVFFGASTKLTSTIESTQYPKEQIPGRTKQPLCQMRPHIVNVKANAPMTLAYFSFIDLSQPIKKTVSACSPNLSSISSIELNSKPNFCLIATNAIPTMQPNTRPNTARFI